VCELYVVNIMYLTLIPVVFNFLTCLIRKVKTVIICSVSNDQSFILENLFVMHVHVVPTTKKNTGQWSMV